MRSVAYLNVMLSVLTVLLGLMLWTMWTNGPQISGTAYGQGIPDEGAQNEQIIGELKLLNQKAEDIKGLLVSGQLQVVVSMPDNPTDAENR